MLIDAACSIRKLSILVQYGNDQARRVIYRTQRAMVKLSAWFAEIRRRMLRLWINCSLRSKSFIDTLNRLEQLELLVDKNIWLELRKIRNNIAHQYEDEPERSADALNTIFEAKTTLESIYLVLKTRYTLTHDEASG